MIRVERKRAAKSLRVGAAALLFVLIAVTCIQLLTLAAGAPAIEGWMLSTGPLP